MNKKILMFVTIVAFASLPVFAMAQDVPGTGDTGTSADVPSTGDTNTSANPSTGDTNTSTVPSTGDTNSSTVPGTGDTNNSAGAPTSDNGSNGGGSSSGGSSSGGSSSGGGSYSGGGSSYTTPVVSVNYGTCPLITSYMKFGGNNDSAQVTRLQNFLKSREIDVEVTGTFDAKTVEAVKAFQSQYLSDIMGPWSATLPSGMVYITTAKKINEIACKQSLTLSADELSIINNYKQSPQIDSELIGTSDEVIDLSGATSGPELGTGADETNTAAVGNVSILRRFWNFIKSLF